MRIQLILFTCFSLALPIHAETAYIKDEVFVPVRSGASPQHRILHKGLKSSTRLEILGRSDDNNWINIKTPGGVEGWMPAQYISTTPTAAIELATAKQNLNRLTQEHSELSDKYKQVSDELAKVKTSLSETETAQQKSTMELHRIKSISSGAIELDIKYQKLLEEHELLQTANDTLNAENDSLKSDQRFSYMVYGAMLVILGMLMAVIIPRLKIKKRNSEWAN